MITAFCKYHQKYFCKNNAAAYSITVFIILLFSSCQKEIKLNYDNAQIKQVIISNLYPDMPLTVNISKSRKPDNFNSLEFLFDCKVDLYEDGIFMETLPFVLKDTLSGLGYYTSTFNLRQNKTYKIISTHNELGTAEATEYLPTIPALVNFALLQHADSLHTPMRGQYIIAFQDSASFSNYYYISTYYRVLKPTVNNAGDTVYKYDYIWNIPSYSPDVPNVFFNRSFTTDAHFDGQLTSFTVDFPSQYNTIYKEILLVVELSNTGKNFYDWNVQQIKYGVDYLNDGQYERINIKSNIINGFGHFTANSSVYLGIPIR